MLLQRRRNSHISLTTLDQRRPNNPVRLLAFDKGPHIRRAGITSTGYGHRLANRGEGTAQDAITRVTAGEQFQRLAQARNCVPPSTNNASAPADVGARQAVRAPTCE